MTTLKIDKPTINVNKLLDSIQASMDELKELDLNNASITGEINPGRILELKGMAIVLKRQHGVIISNTTGIRFKNEQTKKDFCDFLRFLDISVNPDVRQTQTADTAAAGLFFSHTTQGPLGERDALGTTTGRRPTIRRSTRFLGNMLKHRLPIG